MTPTRSSATVEVMEQQPTSSDRPTLITGPNRRPLNEREVVEVQRRRIAVDAKR